MIMMIPTTKLGIQDYQIPLGITKTETLTLPLSLHYFCCAVNDFAENSVPGSGSTGQSHKTQIRQNMAQFSLNYRLQSLASGTF